MEEEENLDAATKEDELNGNGLVIDNIRRDLLRRVIYIYSR